ncbi:type II toxin-antitoxin system Phd/YefM family antitoxin [Mycobacterium sp.]|uniref:type II toxin-antitoxin system Phd/YefM family antitoxin n=1 Tax=Mycobacterium sp. TaxID=1785 RepID=UPI003C730820
MRRIPHRELRNNSSQILDDVKNGEVIEVTNHGEVVAVLIPPAATPYERLVAAGKVHAAGRENVLAHPGSPHRSRRARGLVGDA